MAYYLEFSGGSNYVNLASSISIGGATSYILEADILINTGTLAELLSNTGNNRPQFNFFDPDTIQFFRLDDSGSIGGTYIQNQRFTLKYELTSTQLEITTNDGVFTAARGTSDFGFNRIGANRNGGENLEGRLYGLKIYKNGTLVHNYNPSASNGTGTTLEDTEGGNNGTLNNFSGTTNSWWVSFGSSTLTLAPASITSLEAFGTQVITTGLVTITPSGISSLESFGTTAVATSALLTPSAIASLEAFGTTSVSTEKTLSPSSIASLEAFGNAVLSAGGVNISPNGITTLEAFGTADVAGVLVTVSPTSIASLEAFGNAVLQRLLVSLLPTGIVTQESFGTPLVVGGDAILIPIENRQTWNAIATYLRKVTFKGSNNDVIVSWLRSEGIVDGAYNDLWDRYLLQNGYLALTLTDKYAAWRQGVVTELFNSSGVMTCGGTLSCTEIIPCG
jgi:hypothetical protein